MNNRSGRGVNWRSPGSSKKHPKIGGAFGRRGGREGVPSSGQETSLQSDAGSMQEKYPRRILTSLDRSQVLIAVGWLSGATAANPKTPIERLLELEAEENRDAYRRGINVMLQVIVDGKKLSQLREALVKGEDLPDGTTRDLSPEDGGIECKYF